MWRHLILFVFIKKIQNLFHFYYWSHFKSHKIFKGKHFGTFIILKTVWYIMHSMDLRGWPMTLSRDGTLKGILSLVLILGDLKKNTLFCFDFGILKREERCENHKTQQENFFFSSSSIHKKNNPPTVTKCDFFILLTTTYFLHFSLSLRWIKWEHFETLQNWKKKKLSSFHFLITK